MQVENSIFLEVHLRAESAQGTGRPGLTEWSRGNLCVPGKPDPSQGLECKKRVDILLEGWLTGGWRGHVQFQGVRNKGRESGEEEG